MWRGVVKGVCVPLTGDTPRIGAKRQIGSWRMPRDKFLLEIVKRQVWNTVLKREAVGMGRIHVCDTCVAPCDDPENQMFVEER